MTRKITIKGRDIFTNKTIIETFPIDKRISGVFVKEYELDILDIDSRNKTVSLLDSSYNTILLDFDDSLVPIENNDDFVSALIIEANGEKKIKKIIH